MARQNPDLNVMVLGHGSPNGFLRRAFEAGADDIVMLPATPEQIRFEIHNVTQRDLSDTFYVFPGPRDEGGAPDVDRRHIRDTAKGFAIRLRKNLGG